MLKRLRYDNYETETINSSRSKEHNFVSCQSFVKGSDFQGIITAYIRNSYKYLRIIIHPISDNCQKEP